MAIRAAAFVHILSNNESICQIISAAIYSERRWSSSTSMSTNNDGYSNISHTPRVGIRLDRNGVPESSYKGDKLCNHNLIIKLFPRKFWPTLSRSRKIVLAGFCGNRHGWLLTNWRRMVFYYREAILFYWPTTREEVTSDRGIVII